ncbi:MAG: Gfo/Idh/MocA family oxidoreductase [Actinomycetota bacterium]
MDEAGAGTDTRTSTGLGVLGAGSFVATAAVLPAIDAASGVHLVAAASRSGTTDSRWAAAAVRDYDDVLAHPEVDAVYLPLPNGLHEEWTIKAALAGKHVLCEKPLAPTPQAAARMADACRRHDVLLAEAWMTPFDPRWRRMLDTVHAGRIGAPDRIDARFTFTIGPEAAGNYRWQPDHGGGALLDVGVYTLGMPVELWGASPGEIAVEERRLSETGVDARTDVVLTWPGGQRAHVVCSFVDEEAQRISIAGPGGTLTADGDVFTGGVDATDHHVHDGEIETITAPGGDPYRAMVETFGASVRGERPWPRPAERSVEMLQLIERIVTEASRP